MKKRNTNLDIIRCTAVLLVLSVHFFLNNGFYTEIVTGKKMYIASVVRQGAMICVPLFIMLTGYLMNKKRLSRTYYMGIKRVLIIYILCTLCICGYRSFYLEETWSLADVLFNITSYQQYSWYIEMYIGLYLLIPFLNILYNSLKGKNEKRTLIIVLLVLTVFPSVFNTFDNTVIPVADTQIVPEWWSEIYPFLYYFLGAYISEYREEIKLSLPVNFLFSILSIVVFGTYSYWRSYDTKFVWGKWCTYNGFTNVIVAYLVFVFLLRINVESWSERSKKIVAKISELSLSIYLLSWIFDNYAYGILIAEVEQMKDRLIYYFIMVAFVFVCSFVLAYLIDFLYQYGNKVLKKLYETIKTFHT